MPAVFAGCLTRRHREKIAITHHVPTIGHYTPAYKGDDLNEAFATPLDNLILNTRPDCWICGHHHRNIADFKIGQTRVLTGQLGYVQNGENRLFDSSKHIKL